MTTPDGLVLIQKVWNDNLGWVGTDPQNGLVWTKGLWLVKGLCERGLGWAASDTLGGAAIDSKMIGMTTLDRLVLVPKWVNLDKVALACKGAL
eukprot:5454960-Amphidinium_carterae.1